MKKVEAIIRSDKLEDLKEAISKSDIAKGMTVSQVLGYGSQKGFAEYVRGQKVVPTLLVKVKVEIIVVDAMVDKIVDLIIKSVHTGEIGDGKIFILPIDRVVRIRTGETDADAL
ncbi:MAG: P-II family nitrogen regulator [Streptococcus sp.]|nr:P-II family nitrogen regulator [Streptococcus sp.]